MLEFKIDDISGITEYIKSLDIYDQFDKIIVNHITEHTPMGRRATSIETLNIYQRQFYLVES